MHEVPAEQKLKISLCLLTWNEIAGCKHDVSDLPLLEFDEVYAIDGGSTDGTVEYLESQGITVYQQPVRGYNQAYIHAFSRCTTDFLILFHPKGSIDPSTVRNFRRLFAQGYDLVVASRVIRGARNEEDGKFIRPRKWFVMGLGILSSAIWRKEGPLIWDVLHGFRGMRREAFFEIDPLEKGLSIDLEMVVRGYRKRLRMIELPIEEKPRLAGETHFSAYRTGKQLLAYIVQELKRPA